MLSGGDCRWVSLALNPSYKTTKTIYPASGKSFSSLAASVASAGPAST
jgi:hypothetical protein